MWQDYVIAFVSLLFGVILLPQLKDVWRGQSLNLFTAGLTTVGLFVLVLTFATMEYWVSMIADTISGTIWLFIFLLSWKHRNNKSTTSKVS